MNPAPRRTALLGITIAGVLIVWAVSQFTRENFNAVSLLVAAFSFYYLGGKFYSGFLAKTVLKLDDNRPTPAHKLRDNSDYMPFRRWTLFGMHFAWIAGPGPLIGPTLAAQFGFLPGFLWIVLGSVLMGCVQDMVILAFSTRRNGMSLARMVKNEISPVSGFLASLTVLFILEILLGVLGLFVVNALKGSPWGTFTIFSSIPIAFLVGWYMTKFRPGHEGQATAIGVFLLICATAGGAWVAATPAVARLFNLSDVQLAVAIVIYGIMAAALPAWMLLAPRDNISTYLKIGTVALLAVGIFFAQPVVRMPAVTQFVDGSGPIFGGSVFPFCFIVIACGAISGFHSLISSGVTPRFVDKESDIRFIGYGAMLTESFVGVMALIAAITLVPGVYLAMNHPPLPGAAPIGKQTTEYAAKMTAKISGYGSTFTITPAEMDTLAKEVQEDSLYSRTGGGPALAVGMARIFSGVLGGKLMAFWYHFAIMFEAVFILTVLDSGTRVIRFVLQEMVQDWRSMRSPREETHAVTLPVWLTSVCAVLGWGFILAWGIVDKEGGTKALIKMFGTANQMLAVIALTLATVIMLKQHRRYVWVTLIPAICVAISTLTAGFLTLFSGDPRVGAIAAIRDVTAKAASGAMPAAKAAIAVQNAWLTAAFIGVLMLLVLSVLLLSLRELAKQWKTPTPIITPEGVA